MKKIFYFASVAAIVLSGCSKDDTEISPVDNGALSKIVATVEGNDVTRTTLSPTEDGKYEFVWSKGDAIGVFDENANSAQNVAFTLDPVDDGKTSGTFISKDYELLCGKNYIAYYPYTAGIEKPSAVTDLKLQVLPNQNYSDASVTTLSVPAVAKNFEVSEDGEAAISMQSLVSYVAFKVNTIVPINKLTLKIKNAEGTYLNIAGTGTIKEYTLNKATRYYLSNDNMDSGSIVLTCGRKTDTSCHEENTYVFVIPGGLLGCGAATTGEIYVNDDTEAFATRSFLKGSAAAQKENAFIYFNTKKDDKLVVPTYNPKDAVIIKDQLELLTYIREYNAATEPADKKDAYLCSDAVLDFSRDAMIKISTEMGGQNADISNYLANGFPSIKSFSNTITGNGAVISGVEINNETGIFGEILGGGISGITFKDVVAKDVLLTGNIKNSTIEDVTIDNCVANSIFGDVRPDALAGITVVDEKAEKSITNVAKVLRLGSNLTIKSIETFNVGGPLFANVGLGSGSHQVITVEEPCEVSDLLGSMVPVAGGNSDVYSILIAGTSYWTGGAVQATKTNAKSEVEILYAEQLAYAAQNGATNVILMNNMDLGGSIVNKDNDHLYIWERDAANAITSINGNGKTVSDVYMQSSEAGGVQADLAPFTADAISNLTVDGVKIYIITDEDTFVPAKVAGLSLKSNSVSKVTVNNIDIEGIYDGLNKGDIAYAASMQPHVGLLLAEAEDAQLNECVVAGTSNIKGYIGSLVGYATLNVAEKEMQVYDCTATLTIDADAVRPLVSAKETLQELKNDYNTSYYGQPIGVLKNASGAARTIRFKGNVTPVMFLDKDNSNGAINVVVNDAQVK